MYNFFVSAYEMVRVCLHVSFAIILQIIIFWQVLSLSLKLTDFPGFAGQQGKGLPCFYRHICHHSPLCVLEGDQSKLSCLCSKPFTHPLRCVLSPWTVILKQSFATFELYFPMKSSYSITRKAKSFDNVFI